MTLIFATQLLRLFIYLVLFGLAVLRLKPRLAAVCVASFVTIALQALGMAAASAVASIALFVPAFIVLALYHMEEK